MRAGVADVWLVKVKKWLATHNIFPSNAQWIGCQRHAKHVQSVIFFDEWTAQMAGEHVVIAHYQVTTRCSLSDIKP